MPSDLVQRDQRHQAIREMLGRETIRRQGEIADRLRSLGFEVAQSSVSRDLRELGVGKIRGRYVVPAEHPAPEPAEDPAQEARMRSSVTGIAPAGPNLLVVHTSIGAASAVGLVIDQAQWPEVVGTVAGDDTLFIATAGRRGQQHLLHRLKTLTGGGVSQNQHPAPVPGDSKEAQHA